MSLSFPQLDNPKFEKLIFDYYQSKPISDYDLLFSKKNRCLS